MIQFTVIGEPVAQGRPRFSTQGGTTRAYDPKKSSDFKQYVRLVASQYAPSELLEGELRLVVDVYRAIPKYISKSKTKLEQAKSGALRPTSKPDVDNYVKGIKDALNKVIWKDDSQIVELNVRKWYSDKPRIEIEVSNGKPSL
jgi:Holliday junction resolvase RusA-like endonuclease